MIKDMMQRFGFLNPENLQRTGKSRDFEDYSLEDIFNICKGGSLGSYLEILDGHDIYTIMFGSGKYKQDHAPTVYGSSGTFSVFHYASEPDAMSALSETINNAKSKVCGNGRNFKLMWGNEKYKTGIVVTWETDFGLKWCEVRYSFLHKHRLWKEQ